MYVYGYMSECVYLSVYVFVFSMPGSPMGGSMPSSRRADGPNALASFVYVCMCMDANVCVHMYI
jgi:hypothetical protein